MTAPAIPPMSIPDDVFDIPESTILRETDKAILVRSSEFGDDEVWVPKSVIHEDSSVFAEGDEGTLLVKRWFAEKQKWL
jgi:hypothetical protein